VTDTDQTIEDYAVLMFAADAEKWKWPSRFVRRGQLNQQGLFSLSGLLPGEYLAVALRDVPGNAWVNPEFLATIRNRATPVSVGPGTSQTLVLKLMK
jgi:hypothetical protein